jgi:hypothetical protein
MGGALHMPLAFFRDRAGIPERIIEIPRHHIASSVRSGRSCQPARGSGPVAGVRRVAARRSNTAAGSSRTAITRMNYRRMSARRRRSNVATYRIAPKSASAMFPVVDLGLILSLARTSFAWSPGRRTRPCYATQRIARSIYRALPGSKPRCVSRADRPLLRIVSRALPFRFHRACIGARRAPDGPV